jgi:hypothetical protein
MDPYLGCGRVSRLGFWSCALHCHAADAAAVRGDLPRGGDAYVATGESAIEREVYSARSRSRLREVQIQASENEVEAQAGEFL